MALINPQQLTGLTFVVVEEAEYELLIANDLINDSMVYLIVEDTNG